MKKSNWKFLYDKDKNTNFPLREKSGVYLIKDKEIISYIGKSSVDLYKSLYHHFTSWKWSKKSPQERVTYEQEIRWNKERFTARVIYTTPSRAEKLEQALIKKYEPRDNKQRPPEIELTEEEKKIIKEFNEQKTYLDEYGQEKIKSKDFVKNENDDFL